MQKIITTIALLVAAVSVTFSITANDSRWFYGDNYAQDRAEIENLQARYLFALDWADADAYAATFTEDGELDWALRVEKGRKEIHAAIEMMGKMIKERDARNPPHKLPSRLRRFISNIVLDIHGDTATGKAYWFEFNNDGGMRRPYIQTYGVYEDELRKVDGKWLFSKRKIINEFLEGRLSGLENPAL